MTHSTQQRTARGRSQATGGVAVIDIWTFEIEPAPGQTGTDMQTTPNLTGFSVEATDGKIGKVDEATYEVGSSYIVVDTGPWIFGKKVLVPAGIVDRIDLDEQNVYVNRTKDEIKDSPEYDESRRDDTAFREDLGSYYGSRRTTGDRDVL